jgi:hypothetical protein
MKYSTLFPGGMDFQLYAIFAVAKGSYGVILNYIQFFWSRQIFIFVVENPYLQLTVLVHM